MGIHVVQRISVLEPFQRSIQDISPGLVHRFLTQPQKQHLIPLKDLPAKEKHKLLIYLGDNIQYLDRLPLLPLENGEFATYLANSSSSNNNITYYYTRDKNQQLLLPGYTSSFLSSSLEPNIITKLISKSKSNVKLLTMEAIATLLPDGWKQPFVSRHKLDASYSKWLTLFHEHCQPHDISSFKAFPMIPTAGHLLISLDYYRSALLDRIEYPYDILLLLI